MTQVPKKAYRVLCKPSRQGTEEGEEDSLNLHTIYQLYIRSQGVRTPPLPIDFTKIPLTLDLHPIVFVKFIKCILKNKVYCSGQRSYVII